MSEIWYFIMREEYALWVFERRAWKKTFWCKKDEVTADGRKLHNEEFQVVYFSPN
jgi:hypothetical protein